MFPIRIHTLHRLAAGATRGQDQPASDRTVRKETHSMSVITMAEDKLAISGGPAAGRGLAPAPWPPVDEQTEKRLVEVYRSRAWSFGGPVETSFAQKYAEYHGAKHGILMVNGTVTL